MNIELFLFLVVGCVVLAFLERLGVPTTLQLDFKGDVKRETRWFAQYGQAACTVVAALILWQLNGPHRKLVVPLLAGVFGVSVLATFLKRLLGRVRPNRENAGRFLGPTLKHANFRESFPSSHSACAVAMTVILAAAYPSLSPILWGLAIFCAGLRYIMDAHWPSDVLGGIALGYAGAHFACLIFGI